MKKEFVSKNCAETEKIAQDLIKDFPEDRNVILLEGDLGAGKTTFSQFVLKTLGAEGPFTSPTFVIMKEYKIKLKVESKKWKVDSDSKFESQITNHKLDLKVDNNSKFKIQNSKFHVVFHIDCYRMESEEEMLDLGWEEIVSDKSNLVLVEWPEKIEGILPKKYVKIKFDIKNREERKIRIIKK
ncbi:MAG: tRNA (adenosine(37)-N6)-threonylcarbamoyltransferase complex ATPase subunit type 1 TsaE [Patescibacteria group bacterium]